MRGRAFVVGAWIHEREILGADAPTVPTADELAEAAEGLFRRLGVESAAAFEAGDILVTGRGFASGTLRDYAALLLRRAGVGAILCESVDPRFRQSAIRLGLPVLSLAGLGKGVHEGDELIVSVENGTIENLGTGRMLIATPPTPHELTLLGRAPGLQLLGVAAAEADDPDVMEIPSSPRSRGF